MQTKPLIELTSIFHNYNDSNFSTAGKTSLIEVLHNVTMTINEGVDTGIVGPSGCGKSTLAKIIMLLETAIQGRVFYQGKVVTPASPRSELQVFRQKNAIVFQNPRSALNPRLRIIDSITEAPLFHQKISEKEKLDYTVHLLQTVGLTAEITSRFPHQFSGGELQRICIARALAMEPNFLLCDEPVANLDFPIQQEILHLLKELKSKQKMTLLLITHDFSLIETMVQQVHVMEKGQIVESATTEQLFTAPKHPCTKTLLDARPASLTSILSKITS